MGMADTEVFDVPMELGLEFMAIICSDFAYTERELLDNVIDEVDRVCLSVLFVDFQGANAGCVIDCSILEPACLLALFSDESQELDVHLDMMTRNLFVIAFGMNFAKTRSAREPIQAIALEYPVYRRIG